ncbi:hypothetical protein QVD17_41384 [Tagetes erecta]|uniref:Ribonucleotide reductase large subunit C-terminal domain-containing protein n=1 Tax=Tagetes erecta TaxID=13708 RepID=A0AAD8NFK4_TARER|nr:hypothetical protein QVD17_41384 [Tagetes erecta]
MLTLKLRFRESHHLLPQNLNKIIDVNYYPVETAKRSNLRHRPIGIGVQGLADTFILLGIPFDSPEAQQLNKDIFETIYNHALKASSELAEKEGTYVTYDGSPVSKGVLQPEMWGVTPSDRWDWNALRSMIAKMVCGIHYLYLQEFKQRTLVDMAVDFGCYIDQSQSLNIHMDQPNFGKLKSLHFNAWSKDWGGQSIFGVLVAAKVLLQFDCSFDLFCSNFDYFY